MIDISVIIPCYNCMSLVAETLLSLTKQTFQTFEVICVNDGSTDETLSVLESWQKRNVLDLKIINKPNGGVSSARNAGIQAAKGEYILFLDSDDLYHPVYIQRLYEAIVKTGADVAYCWLTRNKEKFLGRYETGRLVSQSQRESMENLLYRMHEVGFYCFLYQKNRILQENLRFDENTKRFEDREFNWKYLCHCESAVLVDAPLYFYRVVKNSVTNTKTVQWRTDGLEATKRIIAYLDHRNCAFAANLKDYLLPRVMWAMAKNYAISGAKDLFMRLSREYDVKRCMKRTAWDKNKMVALASWMYRVHPMLFYHIVRLRR